MAGVSSPSVTAGAGVSSGQGIQLTDLQFRSYRIGADNSVAMAQTTVGDWGYAGINTATTTTVKSGVGQLGTVIFLGATLAACTIYDSLTGSGTVIAPTFTPTATGPVVFNVAFSTGLTLVTAGTNPITVLYR